MKHIVVIPYYCSEEIRRFWAIAHIWKNLTRTEIEYEFLLSARYDCRPSKALWREFSVIAPTRSMRCVTQGRGIRFPEKGLSVEGPTAMFWDSMEFINKNYENDGGFVLWFESDMVPLKPNWLDILQAHWTAGRYITMGKFISTDWIQQNFPEYLEGFKPHINGAACYCKDFSEKASRENFNHAVSWDTQIFSYIARHYPGRYKFLDCIDFPCRQKTMTSLPHVDAVLLHGIKDDSARKYVCRQHGISFPVAHWINRMKRKIIYVNDPSL